MPRALLLALAAALPIAAQTTVPAGYHIVTAPPADAYATPARPVTLAASGPKKPRRPPRRANSSRGQMAGAGFRAPTMSTQISGALKKH